MPYDSTPKPPSPVAVVVKLSATACATDASPGGRPGGTSICCCD
ncbi:hypothetical protein [Streptomyces sp. 8L]|nr:hypothetical protein [Streptomyces sp. 8L]